ncbi:Wzz/FepE/Etk N-terminal domain-containing protein [Anaerococcus porci]|uniref:YveK family protein n=1 Tax=Anaerococcus porci TaxID=2652269 RepID=UPI002A7474FA|nr:Wzz/FepE/Etk N-terminal domain-containing protein [Anaerococcus porci]MDY3007063.1 Wzz/FepE/Etk N-terminal domain-containing protein [Anaerococcus porci]
MEKIRSSEIGNIIKNNIKYVIIVTLALGVFGFFYTRNKIKDSYTAEAAVMVSENKGEDITYNSLMLNEKISNIYQEFLSSNDLYMKVKENLGIEDEPESIKKNLKTNLNSQAGIITFEYKAKGEKDTGEVLQAIIEQFRQDIKEYVGKDNVEYIQNVNIREDGLGEAIKKAVFLAVFAFVLSLLAVVTKEFFQGKVKSKLFFDNIGIEILGVIDEK